MIIIFSADAWDDYLYWQEHDPKRLKKINDLIKEVIRHPFMGTGKPEALKGDLSGWWSRRINREHRMVYRITGEDSNRVEFAQLRFHY